MLDDTGAFSDLKVTALNVPGDLAVGQPSSITYTVSNAGDGLLAGASRQDAAYLSDDPYLDAQDRLLASAVVTGDVAAGGTCQGAVTVTLPAMKEGVCYLILSVNDQWQAVEWHRLNNEYATAVKTIVPAPAAWT